MAMDVSPAQSLRRPQPSIWLPSYSMVLENPSNTPPRPSPAGQSVGGLGETSPGVARLPIVSIHAASTNNFALLYHSTPLWKASSSKLSGKVWSGAKVGLTTGWNSPKVGRVCGDSQPRIQFQSWPHAFVGSYRPVRKWLSLVVATRTFPSEVRKRIGLTPSVGSPKTA